MKRRGFLQALAGGVAAITGVSATAREQSVGPVVECVPGDEISFVSEFATIGSVDATHTGEKFVAYRADTMFSEWRAS